VGSSESSTVVDDTVEVMMTSMRQQSDDFIRLQVRSSLTTMMKNVVSCQQTMKWNSGKTEIHC
jgi:hypothetical protein